MANPSVQIDRLGPDWPLGFIAVLNPGQPVSIMSLVDATNKESPNTADPPTTSYEYNIQCNQIVFWGFKPGAGHGCQRNTGNVYVMRKGVGGDGSRDDDGSRVGIIEPGQSFSLIPAATRGQSFSPYRYFLDADNANDGAYPVLVI